MSLTYSENREKENLQNFKKVIRDMMLLLRNSLQAETVSLHWINHRRDIVVLENYTTNLKNVVYQDRVRRNEHFLGNFDTIKSITRLQRDVHFDGKQLDHYTSTVPVSYVYLIPLVYNADTLAITSVETGAKSELNMSDEESITAYQKALGRLLHNYQELNDLSHQQSEWTEYDDDVDRFSRLDQLFELASELTEQLQKHAGSNGGVMLLARGLKSWNSVLYSAASKFPPPVGLTVQEGTISDQALKSGEPVYYTHANANPKRISYQEPLCKGATLAVPVMHRQRRQLLALVYSEDFLVFTEAVTHKITNFCRVAGLKLETLLPHLGIEEDVFANKISCYTSDLYKGALNVIRKHQNNYDVPMKTWVGMFAISNISTLRTRYRPDDLVQLQKMVLSAARPQKFGYSGIISEYSDYVYSFILQSTDESAFDSWIQAVRKEFQHPVSFADDQKIEILLRTGLTELTRGMDPESAIQNSRKAMNEAVKQQKFLSEA